MAASVTSEAAASGSSSFQTKAGWALSGLAILFLGIDAGAKMFVPAVMAAYTPPHLRIPTDPSFYRLLARCSLCRPSSMHYQGPLSSAQFFSPAISAAPLQRTSLQRARSPAAHCSASMSALQSAAHCGCGTRAFGHFFQLLPEIERWFP